MPTSPMRGGPGFTLGPIPIPRRRQIAQNLFRFRSIKAGMRTVTCESKLEADYFYALEGDPRITWFCEQGFRIDQAIGKKPFYTLDAAVRTRNGDAYLCEVKHSSSLVSAVDGIPRPPNWHSVEAACFQFGYNVRFVTEKDLVDQKLRIANWRVLLPHALIACGDPDVRLAERLLGIADHGAGIRIADACAAQKDVDDAVVVAHIAMLLHAGDLRAPLNDARVSLGTVVQRRHS